MLDVTVMVMERMKGSGSEGERVGGGAVVVIDGKSKIQALLRSLFMTIHSPPRKTPSDCNYQSFPSG